MKEVAHVFPVCQTFADEGGTDVNQGRIHRFYVGRKCMAFDFVSLTGIDEYGIVVQYFLGRFPAVEGTPVVCSDDEVKLFVRVDCRELAQGVDRIGRAGQPELEVGSAEAGITSHGCLGKLQAQAVIQQLFVLLERILGGDEKPYLVYISEFAQVIGQGQMPDVNGIERASEDSDSYRFLFHLR